MLVCQRVEHLKQFGKICPMMDPAGAGLSMLTWLGVYWWDPWSTIYSSTMDPSWVYEDEHVWRTYVKKTVRQVVGKSGRSLFYPLFKGVTWTYRPGAVQTLIFFPRGHVNFSMSCGWNDGMGYSQNDKTSHDGSMVLLYMVSWIPSIYPQSC